MSFQTIRRGLVASTLILAGVVIAAPAMAAPTGDSVDLGGTVEDMSTVTATPTTGAGLANDLNLYGEGSAQNGVVVKVADLDVTTNSDTGVTVTATGDAGLFDGASSTLPYDVLIVDGTAPVAAAFSSNTDTDSVLVAELGVGAERELYIMYDAPAQLQPGDYESVITLTVAAQ